MAGFTATWQQKNEESFFSIQMRAFAMLAGLLEEIFYRIRRFSGSSHLIG
jgi:hypothetical protein